MKEKPDPCLEKKCSRCCDPVKTRRFMPEDKIPIDKEGHKLWTKRNEVLIPEDGIDRTRLDTYDCKNFDPETGKCKDYANRPDICKDSSCVNPDSPDSPEEQFQKSSKRKFIKLKVR